MNIASQVKTDAADPLRDHVAMVHELAKGLDGVLVVSTFNATLSNDRGTITHHKPGDIDSMMAAIEAHAGTPGANVYLGLQVMRRGLQRGHRGAEADIVAVLGLVADMDGDTGKNSGEYPIPPNYVLETSPGNLQTFWLFDRPVKAAEAKAIARGLKVATGSDHGTADITHVWRVPGTLNWPSRVKLDRGRSATPASVTVSTPWDGNLTDPLALLSAAGSHSAAPTAQPVTLGNLPDVDGIAVSPKLAVMLAANDVGDRSAHAASVVEQLAFDDHSAETAAAMFLSATGDWFARYEGKDARKDFTRLWAKFGSKHTETLAVGAKLAASLKPANDNFASDTSPVDLWAHRSHPPLPSGLLPPIIEDFARIQGDLMGIDPGGLAMAALAVCAAAIPDRIVLRPKRYEDYTESARIWVAVVGNPSTKKSPLINAASRPLKKADGELFRNYVEEMQRYEQLKKVDSSQKPPKKTRLRVEDTTVEGAQEVLMDSPDGLLCLQDELSGWFGSLDRYASGKGASKDKAFWLTAYNGGQYVINRVGRGMVMIPNLSMSMLGGIQPDVIRSIAQEMNHDGLMQRFFPIILGGGGPGRDVEAPPVVIEYQRLVDRLNKLGKPQSGLGGGNIMVDKPLRFDDEAQEFRHSLVAEFYELAHGWESVNKMIGAHFGKYDGAFSRLCIIWQCAESDGFQPPQLVTLDTAKRVAAFMKQYLMQHAIAFYTDVLGLSDRQDAVMATAGHILGRGLTEISVRDARRGDRTMRGMDNLDAQAVLEQLDAFGWLDPIPTARSDSLKWKVRPAVHGMFAERAKAEETRRERIRKLIKSHTE